LDAGQGEGSEPVDVGLEAKLASVDHGGEAGADVRFPAIEAGSKHSSDVVVAFAKLTDKVGDGTASPRTALLLQLDEGVRPSDQAVPGAETGEQGALSVEDSLIGGLSHSPQQIGLVVEVVVELAARCSGALTDLIQAGPDGTFLGHHIGSSGDDAPSGLASPLGGGPNCHDLKYPASGLDSPIWTCSDITGLRSPLMPITATLGGPMSVTIREQSEQMKAAAAAERLPAAVVEVFDRSIRDLVDQGVPTGTIAVGHTLESFTLRDAGGAPVTLDEVVETGPAVIVFYRGGWCPYCNLALRTYQRELLPELAAFSSRLVAISPQSSDQSLSTAEKAELDFTVLSDPGNRVAKKIGIVFQQADEVLAAQRKLGLDLAQVNAEGSTQLPRPTVLIVDQDRKVRFVDVQPDYTARTEVDDILAALACL
jgi:peroxiredoxin